MLPPLPSRCRGVISRGRQDPHGLQAHGEGLALVEQSLAGPRKLWGHGLRNAFYWLGPPSLDHAPGLGSFCIPSWCPSSRLVCTRSRAVLGRGESGVRAFTGLDCGMHQTEAGCGKPAATTADLSLPPALGLFSMCRPLISVLQAFPDILSGPNISHPAKEACLLCVRLQQRDTLSLASVTHSPGRVSTLIIFLVL